MIKLYNSYSKNKEFFTPINAKNIGLYVCGPTVYSSPHIGNARISIVFDLLLRVLKTRYNFVNYVRNYTDIDDKIIDAAKNENISIYKLTNKMIMRYMDDMNYLGLMPPIHAPRATDHISEMIVMIKKLIELNYAYESNGHVLFETKKWHSIGALSKRPLLSDESESRLLNSSYKKNPEDFVLWKPSSDDEPGWNSPWGKGRPGWHIECSAMSRKFLGDTFDIHGGGIDLLFPHHENENSQSCAACSVDKMANYWMHVGMLMVDGQKMSKSLGNIIRVEDLRNCGISGSAIKLTMLMSHYRSNLNWTEENLTLSRKLLTLWSRDLEGVRPAKKIDHIVLDNLYEDLNTPAAITRMQELYGYKELDKLAAVLQFLGINYFIQEDKSEITHLIYQRKMAKAEKNWVLSDLFRDQIIEAGYEVKDDGDSSTYQKKFLF